MNWGPGLLFRAAAIICMTYIWVATGTWSQIGRRPSRDDVIQTQQTDAPITLAAYCTMSQGRPYQLAVFGASGFTGVLVVEELVKYLRSSGKQLAWAVAGRSESKLKAALTDVAHRLGDATVKDTPILIADVKDTKSMADLCKQVSVILNVTGPYRFFGEPVVKACMENGADYLDITGEPEFIERMILKYAQAARANGVVAVTTCGFDSVPCDLGVEYTLGQFPDRSLVSSVESYLSLHSENGLKGHYATFESAVHGFGNQAELSKIRKELAQREAAQGWLPRLPILGPKLRMTSGPVLQPQLQKWILPFPGADATVVRRTQRELYHSHQITPTQFAAYMTIPSTFYVGVVMAVGIVFRCLASYKWGRQLLLKFPRLFSWGVFSHEGPSAQDLATTSFDMQFIARAYSTRQGAEAGGQPDVCVMTRVAGPEPGYVATPIILVQAAMTLLEERAKIEPGMLTPALAFRQTTYQSRLQSRGIQFSVLQKNI